MSILISYLCTKSTTLNKAFRQHHAYAQLFFILLYSRQVVSSILGKLATVCLTVLCLQVIPD